jgi:hypothetical protein
MMYRSRVVPPPNQWILIPRPEWHFPIYQPPRLGPRLPLPLRPRVIPYRLPQNSKSGPRFRPRKDFLNKLSNPLLNKLFQKTPLLDKVFSKRINKHYKSGRDPDTILSSRVIPYRLAPIPKMKNDIWKSGFRIPLPSPYAIGCRRPTKLFDLPSGEFHFRLVHPQFGKFFDKWSQGDINWSDARNLVMMEKDMVEILKVQINSHGKLFSTLSKESGIADADFAKNKNKSKLIRPNPYAGFIQKEIFTAHLQEMAMIKKYQKNPTPENLEQMFEGPGAQRYSKQIVDMYHGAIEEIKKKEREKRVK